MRRPALAEAVLSAWGKISPFFEVFNGDEAPFRPKRRPRQNFLDTVLMRRLHLQAAHPLYRNQFFFLVDRETGFFRAVSKTDIAGLPMPTGARPITGPGNAVGAGSYQLCNACVLRS
ncbi:MAG: hypothetical protein CM15mP103_10520 [Gammaproteobacteria bacterium]|nr:MAG: hypothetical protein CM15mP103_10520 [Gammaproteobacteria bacterium]